MVKELVAIFQHKDTKTQRYKDTKTRRRGNPIDDIICIKTLCLRTFVPLC